MSKNIIGLYLADGKKNTNQIRIKHVKNVDFRPEQKIKISDNLISTYQIDKLNVGQIRGNIFQCIFTHHYLARSKKMPVLYIDVVWNRPLRMVMLYRLFVTFEIKSQIRDTNDLFNKRISGAFSIHVCMDNTTMTLEKDITNYPGHKELISKLKTLISSDDMMGVMHEIIDKKKKEFLERYGKPKVFDPKNIISLKDIDDINNDTDE